MKCIDKLRTIPAIATALLFLGACGGGSSGSTPTPPQDTAAPTISAVQSSTGSIVNRIVTLTVTASDDRGVTEVRFFVDGVELGSDTTAPYSIDWDTAGEAEGDHVLSAEARDAAGNVGRSSDVTVTVRNVVQFSIAASGEQEVSPVASVGSATADLTLNLATGELQGNLTVTGITATAAHVHDGFAGTNGPVLVPFEQDPANAALFAIGAAATLDAAAIDKLLAAGLYINVHTAAFPGGELRGQILPTDFVLRFADLGGISTVPQVQSFASGRAAITLDQSTGALVVNVNVDGLDDAIQAHVHEGYGGEAGPVVVALTQDSMDAGRWFVEGATLNAAALDAFAAGRLYINVHSPANPGGEIRGQVLPDSVQLIHTELAGAQEVPAVDSRASGLAALTLDAGALLLTVHVNTSGVSDATGAHLHGAFGGDNGPVEIGLSQDGSDPSHWFAEEQTLSQAQLDALLAGGTYVNVHTPANPGGEIRGQVIPDGILFATGVLDGAQEVPPVNSAAGGTFAVTVDPVAATLVTHVNTTGAADATAAHLHDAYAGTNGGVAVGLTQDPGDVTRWSAIGVTLDASQLAAFEAGRFYVNVHTPANPGGEIRGQVAAPPVEVRFATMSGDQEVPAVTSAAVGIAASTVNRDTGSLTVHLNATGADDATASHVHQGYAGQNGGVAVGLAQDAADAGHWFVVEAQLDEAQLDDYLSGTLYVNLHTPTNPGGEIRGQLVPREVQVVFSALSGDQVVPPVASAATGSAATTVNLDTGSFVAFVNTTGLDDATSAGVHLGGVGSNGSEILAMTQTSGNMAQWSAMSDRLDAGDFAEYRAGRLYLQVASPANVNGEIRGQIVPPDAAEFDNQAPVVTLTAPGDPLSGTVTLLANATDDQGVAIVRFLVDGAVVGSDSTDPYSVDWDTTSVADGQVTITAEADDAAGNTGVSAEVIVTVQNATSVTLGEIQASVFGPLCAACHDGGGNSLPGVLNLTSASASHAALVNVPSIQQSNLDRVEPGDPDASYLIRKLEGGPNITGSRMPQGGPFLDQATVDQIRQWISDGAQNN